MHRLIDSEREPSAPGSVGPDDRRGGLAGKEVEWRIPMRNAIRTVAALCALLLASPVVAAPPIVELYANVSQGTSSDFFALDNTGNRSEIPFEVPDRRLLVVTDILVTPNTPVDGLYVGNIDSLGGNENRIRFRLDSVDAMLHLPLSTGVVFATRPRVNAFASNPGAFTVRLLGYLTAK